MVLIGLFSVSLLGGCGWWNDDKGVFVNRTDDYIDAREGNDLILPPDLVGSRVRDPLPIPPQGVQPNPEYYPKQPPRPNAIFANDNRDEVRIQRLGERRWLVVPESPTTVWPKVRQFLADNGVDIADEAPTYGRIDTEWMNTSREAYRDVVRELIRDEKRDAGVSGGRDRLLLRVEQGLRERNSEVHLRHENDKMSGEHAMVIDIVGINSAVPSIEVDLLNEIGAYIAAKVSEQTVSRVAQEISAGVKSEVTRSAQGTPVLVLNLDRARAWATVAQALNRAEVEVIDNNPDAMEYRVLISESLFTGEGGGWIGGLFGGTTKYDLKLKLMEVDDDAWEVLVTDALDEPANRELAQEVLTLIREFAS